MSGAKWVENLIVTISGDSYGFDSTLDRTFKSMRAWSIGMSAALSAVATAATKEFAAFDDALTRTLARFENIDPKFGQDLAKGIKDAAAVLPDLTAGIGDVAKGFGINGGEIAKTAKDIASGFDSLIPKKFDATGGLAKTATDIAKGFENLLPKSLADTVKKGAGEIGGVLKDTAAGLGYEMKGLGGDIFAKLGVVGDPDAVAKLKGTGGDAFGHVKGFEGMDVLSRTKKMFAEQALQTSMNSLSSPTDMAKAYNPLIKANFGTYGAMDALPTVSKFAAIHQIDASVASTHLTRVMKSLRMESDDTATSIANLSRVADVMTLAVQHGQGDVLQFASALELKAGTALRKYGFTLEEVAGITMQLGENSKFGNAGAQMFELSLRNVEDQFAKHQDMWQSLLGKGNIVYTDEGKMDPAALYRGLEKKIGGLGPEARAKTLHAAGFSGKTVGTIFEFIDSGVNLEKFKAMLEGAGGTVDRVFGNVMKSLQSQMTQFKNILQVIATLIGGTFTPAFTFLNDQLKAGVNWWLNLDEATRSVIVGFVQVGGALLALNIGMRLAGLSVGFLRFAFSLLLGPITLVKNVVGGVFNAIAGTVRLAYDAVVGIGRGIYAAFAGVIGGVGSVAGMILQPFVWAFNAVVFVAKWAAMGIAAAVYYAVPAILSWAKGIYKIMEWAFTSTYALVKSVIGGIMTALGGTIGWLTSTVAAGIGGVISLVFGLVTSVLSIIGFVVTGIAAIAAAVVIILPLLAITAGLATTIGLGIMSLFTMVGGALISVWERLKIGWHNTSRSIIDGMKTAGGVVKDSWNSAKEGVKNFTQGPKETIRSMIGFFYNFQENIGAIANWIGENWENIIQDMGDAFFTFTENMASNIVQFGQLVVNVGATAWKAFWNSLVQFGSPVIKWLNDNWRNMVDDMGYTFSVFLTNLTHNVLTFFDFFAQAAKSAALKMLYAFMSTMEQLNVETKFWKSDEGKKKEKDEISERWGKMSATEDIKLSMLKLGGMKTPMEGFDAGKLKTTGGTFAEDMAKAFDAVADTFGEAGRDLNKTFKQFTADLLSPLQGFESSIKTNVFDQLNFNVPFRPRTPQEVVATIAMPLGGVGLGGIGGGLSAAAMAANEQKMGLKDFVPDILKKFGIGGDKKEFEPLDIQSHSASQFKEYSFKRYVLEGPGGLSMPPVDGITVNSPKIQAEIREVKKAVEANNGGAVGK